MTAMAAIEIPTVANAEAEAALCGALMSENKLIDSIADRLKPEDFSDEFFGHLFSVIVRERSLGRAANPVTLRPYFDAAGYQVLCGLTGAGVQVLAASGIADQVRDLAQRRRLIDGLQQAIQIASSPEGVGPEAMAAAEQAISDAVDSGESDGAELSLGECVSAALVALENHEPGVTCGITPIDDAMGPVRKKNLAILAARPAMGKTLVALSYAKGAARKGHGVLFISLEMSAEELGERAVADEAFDDESGSGVPYAAIVNGAVRREEMGWLLEARDSLGKLPLQIVDTSAITPARLQSTVRRWKRRFTARGQSLDLVIVDYLQKMRVPGTTNRFEVITEISQSLKELAKANDLGVLALAQLSRKVEEREDRRPHLSDLRESGQLEQDADAVLFLLRDEYYLRKAEPHPQSNEHPAWEQLMRSAEGKIDFICAKRRKGAERTTQGRFYGEYQAVRA